MESSNSVLESTSISRPVAPLTVLLAVVFVVFCAILVCAYVGTRRANPVMLDQQGKPLNSQEEPAANGKR